MDVVVPLSAVWMRLCLLSAVITGMEWSMKVALHSVSSTVYGVCSAVCRPVYGRAWGVSSPLRHAARWQEARCTCSCPLSSLRTGLSQTLYVVLCLIFPWIRPHLIPMTRFAVLLQTARALESPRLAPRLLHAMCAQTAHANPGAIHSSKLTN